MSSFEHFGIVGGGAWGTAIGQALVRAGRRATLWAREQEVVGSINANHENVPFLAGIPLDPRFVATEVLAELNACDALVLAVPTQHLRATCQSMALWVCDRPRPILIAAKGIEQTTLELPATIVHETLPTCPIAILSGPTFAAEVAKNLPTAFTLACEDETLGQSLAQSISSRTFRPYFSPDVRGAQIGGAVKNVLAIASGIVTGCGMGDNARAALMTRGLAELMRLALALGARSETLMGLSGLGDLLLTCSSPQSRNMSLGIELGQGSALPDILAKRKTVAEGIYTATAALALAQRHAIEMPIVQAVDAILNHGASVQVSIEALLSRPLKIETR